MAHAKSICTRAGFVQRHLQTFIAWLCHKLEWFHSSLYPKMSQVYSHKTFVKKKKSNFIPWG